MTKPIKVEGWQYPTPNQGIFPTEAEALESGQIREIQKLLDSEDIIKGRVNTLLIGILLVKHKDELLTILEPSP